LREKEKSLVNRRLEGDKTHKKNIKSQYSADNSYLSLEEEINTSTDPNRKTQSLSRQKRPLKMSITAEAQT
jgi:hypothetical protein